MPERFEYPPGMPSWVDLYTPDLAASGSFYGGLFGWEHAEAGPVEQTGGYGFFTLGGKNVGGVMPMRDDAAEGQPPAWSMYVTVADADETAAKVGGAGGSTMVEPMDVHDTGRMAVFADPSGAVFGVWQPRRHKGAEIVSEPGTMIWHELGTRDLDGSKAFYGSVFGWEGRRMDFAGGSYTTWHLPGETAGFGGMTEMDENWPSEVPPHWVTYFATADADATVSKAEELGGAVHVPVFDSEVGRIARLGDSTGAVFAVIQPSGQAG